MDQWAGTVQPLSEAVAGDGRVQRQILAHDYAPVRGHPHIQFERPHTQIEALAEAFDGVFRKQAARTAMAYDLNLSRHSCVPGRVADNQHGDWTMDYTTLGRTRLRVSGAGLSTGGFSRIGIGQSENPAIGIIRQALDLGVNLIDTAAVYGTEAVIGRALKDVARDSVVVCTKASRPINDPAFT